VQLQNQVDSFDDWKEIASGGVLENLKGLAFYDFLFKLNKAIDRRNKEIERNKKTQKTHK